MKAMEKKPSVSHRVNRHGLSCVTHSPAAHVQHKLIGQILRNNNIQSKLGTGQPNDKCGQEGDCIIDEVMRMPESKKDESLQANPLANIVSPLIQRQPEPEKDEEVEPEKDQEEETVQAKKGDGSLIASPSLESDINSIRGGGRPLAHSSRSFFEPRFGTDFSGVRVHTDLYANRLARSINAKAFTVGKDVVFGSGQYSPGSFSEKKLLAHELTHVTQQGQALTSDRIQRIPPDDPTLLGEARRARQQAKTQHKSGTPPDVSHKGFYSFYLTQLAKGGREKGFSAQFNYVNQPSQTVQLKIFYRGTKHLEKMTIQLSAGAVLSPRLLQQTVDSSLFDLNGDGKADLEILLLAGEKTTGINVVVTRPGVLVKNYTIPPPKRQIVPGLGYEMGTLPNGKKYYLQPWTYHIPGGPRYVDENNRGVNPALEFRAEATLDAMLKGYLIALGVLAAIGLGAILLPVMAESAAVAATVARGAGVLRWLFSGSRLVAGGINAGVNLSTQIFAHGEKLDKYNWGSIGLDYVLGAISYSVAKGAVTRWPAPLFSSAAGKLSTWTNLGKQQSMLALYGTLVGLIRAQISNTSKGSTVGAQHVEGVLQGAKSVAIQTFLASPTGKQYFPAGWNDPKIALLSKFFGVLLKFSVREAFGVVPSSSGEPQQGKSQ